MSLDIYEICFFCGKAKQDSVFSASCFRSSIEMYKKPDYSCKSPASSKRTTLTILISSKNMVKNEVFAYLFFFSCPFAFPLVAGEKNLEEGFLVIDQRDLKEVETETVLRQEGVSQGIGIKALPCRIPVERLYL